MQNDFITPFNQDYTRNVLEPTNNVNSLELQQKYNLTPQEVNDFTNHIFATHGKEATINDLETYIKNQGYAPIGESIIEENEQEIQFSKNVILPSMKKCQKYWDTTQTKITVPSKHINATKKPPISTLIGVSAMSGKEGDDVNDYTGKGARIMNVKRYDNLIENLTNLRKVKASTINGHIRKLLKLKTKEFEFVTLETKEGNQEQYYKLDYSDGFVTIDLRIMHYMYTVYSDNIIQAYIIFLWNCRNGWAQLTQPQMAEHLGLSKDTIDTAKTVMNKLVLDGFIEQRTKYKYKSSISKDGIPTNYKVECREYRVVNLSDIEQ